MQGGDGVPEEAAVEAFGAKSRRLGQKHLFLEIASKKPGKGESGVVGMGEGEGERWRGKGD